MITTFIFQIPLEIVDVETTGYVLRLCPFESLAFSGVTLTDDDLDAFIEVRMEFLSIKSILIRMYKNIDTRKRK